MAYETKEQRAKRYQQVCEDYALPDIIERSGVKLTRSGHGFKAPCPLGGHRGYNRGNFSVFQEDGKWFFKCLSCKVSGDVITWILLREKLNERYEAVEWLTGQRESTAEKYTYTPPPPPAPLPTDRAEAFHSNIWQSKQHAQWWQKQGLSLAAMEYFKVGYCPDHRYDYYDGDTGQHKIASYGETYTIPVYHNQQLVNIRHRIKNPRDPKDKYRPDRAGLGAHLFNIDVLSNPKCDTNSVLILAGEKKVMVLHDHYNIRLGGDMIIPIISSTAGAASWLGRYADVWPRYLRDFERVYIGFDPGEEQQAEQTAMLFGRRAHVVMFPDKPDDLLIDDADEGMYIITECIGRAEPLRSTSYWLTHRD